MNITAIIVIILYINFDSLILNNQLLIIALTSIQLQLQL